MKKKIVFALLLAGSLFGMSNTAEAKRWVKTYTSETDENGCTTTTYQCQRVFGFSGCGVGDIKTITSCSRIIDVN